MRKRGALSSGWGVSDLPRFQHQQDDPANERECSYDRRNKMVVGRRNVQAEKLDGLSRSRETDARRSEHHYAERDQNGCDEGF